MPKSSHSQPFDHTHYLAVLRCKEAEKNALLELAWAARSGMTPLIEIPRSLSVKGEKNDQKGRPQRVLLDRSDPRAPFVLDALLKKTATDIKTVWSERPIFLDLQHLFAEWRLPDGGHPVASMWNYARENSLFPPHPIPVVTLQSDNAFRTAIRDILSVDNVGFALRIRREELESSQLLAKIQAVLTQLETQPEKVDLMVDFGCVAENGMSLAWVCARLPLIERWRTFSCIGSSFPKDLVGMEKGQNELKRHEWVSYQKFIEAGEAEKVARIPTYGDYATQYGDYLEPKICPNVSASIRYTTDKNFVVMRGGSLLQGTKGLQYPANALVLCGHEEFGSLVQCAGDAYIADRADKMLEIEEKGKGMGTPTTWLQASLNRHWSLTTKQLSTLFGS